VTVCRSAWSHPRTGIYYYRQPESVGKETDSRSTSLVARFGKLVLAEVDALPPDVLHGLFDDAIQGYWDTSTYEAVVAREAQETDVLRRIANTSCPARRLTPLTGRAGRSACHGEVLRP
jgi:hypothetical protein